MNKHAKILQILEVDLQNMPDNGFTDPLELVWFYARKPDEFIDKVYEEYYGDTCESEAPEDLVRSDNL